MEIKQAKYIISAPRVELSPAPDRPEYAFIGRSNVGKSSLINSLVGSSKLAKVSKTPGKTVMINHFLINGGKYDEGGWYLVDLPGYGYARRSQSQRAAWQKMLETYFNERENLITVFVLIDSRISPQQNDLDFLGDLGTWGVPFNLVFTKTDKSTQAEVAKNIKSFVNRMKEEWEFIPKRFQTSTVKGTGKREILQYIEELNEEYQQEMSKSENNP